MNDFMREWGRWYISFMTQTQVVKNLFHCSKSSKTMRFGWCEFSPWTPHLSHHLHPFIPTQVNGYGPHSPDISGILQLLQSKYQVQLRDKTLLDQRKNICVAKRFISIESKYVFRWEMKEHFVLENDFPKYFIQSCYTILTNT